MSQSTNFSAFIDSTMNETTVERMYQHFYDFIKKLNFTGYFYTAIPGVPKDPNPDDFLKNVLLHATDMQVIANLMQSKVFGRGPVFLRLATGKMEPFTPYDAFVEITGKGWPLPPQLFLKDASIAYTLICPMGNSVCRYGITIFSPERSLKKLRKHIEASGNLAYTAALLFHERWKFLREKNCWGELSPREQECLRWTARGKSADEISAKLSISERTVRFHLSNIGQKLQTKSTTHAVATAISRDLIRP